MERSRASGVLLARLSVGMLVVIAAVAMTTSASGAAPQQRTRVSARIAAARADLVVPTTASNRRAARLDAARLLAAVAVPAGAVSRSSGTGTGPLGDHLLTLAYASAYAYRTWSVTGDPSSVLSFVTAHLPPGSAVVSRGSGSGPGGDSQSITFSWPPVLGVLSTRWLEVSVSTSATGTLLFAESQSEWVVTRPRAEQIPAGVREVVVTDGLLGKPPFLSRRVENHSKVGALVGLFDSLGIIQSGVMSCPGELVGSIDPIVKVTFNSVSGRPLAQATVSSSANQSWPASVPGWSCYPIDFSVLGRRQPPLAGNVIAPIQKLLHVKLATHSI
jgi:hypothetical protein